jgi:hypothetical protein
MCKESSGPAQRADNPPCDNFLYDFKGTPAPGLTPADSAEGRELTESESV